MKNAKDIAKDVINQEHSIVTYQFNGVDLEQGESIISRSTLLLRIFSADNFIILRTKKQKELGFNEFKSSLEGILGRGIEHEGKRYKILGASSSLKDGKLWMADQNTIQNIHSYFASSQEALSYLGVFTSNCHDGIFEIETEIEIVEDGHSINETLCTGDGMGFIPISLLNRLDLPCNQLQVRLIAKQWLAKGTLHPYSGDKILLPKSMIKGKNIPLSGNHSFLLGIRAIAQNLSFRSNWTLMQFMNEETIKSTIPKLKEELDTLDSVLTNHQSSRLPKHGTLHYQLIDYLTAHAQHSTNTQHIHSCGLPYFSPISLRTVWVNLTLHLDPLLNDYQQHPRLGLSPTIH